MGAYKQYIFTIIMSINKELNVLGNEAKEQIKLFDICKYIKGCEFMFAVPNGGHRNYLEAVNLKRQGVRSGVPDLMLPVPKGKYHGLFIEMKFGKNKPTKNQTEYIDYLNSVGYSAIVCYSCDEALETIKKYLTLN